ncbi:MAG TPA: hypothetical protein VES59_04790, partial [Bacteroidota bacterium]|nr:hypothetical protein [Bacteroidota bacterium]
MRFADTIAPGVCTSGRQETATFQVWLIRTSRPAILAVFMCVVVTAPAFGQTHGKPDRQQLLFDFGWRFHLGDAASAEGDFGYGEHASFAKAGDAAGAARPEFN